jgi:DNA-binding IclR family transcriptional regulator
MRLPTGLEKFVEATGAAGLLAVWGPGRDRRSLAPNAQLRITPLGLGTTMPLLNSAHRRVFLSYSPCPVIEPLLRQERERARTLGLRVADIVSEADFGGRLTRVRTSAFRWRKQARPVGSLASQEPAARAR